MPLPKPTTRNTGRGNLLERFDIADRPPASSPKPARRGNLLERFDEAAPSASVAPPAPKATAPASPGMEYYDRGMLEGAEPPEVISARHILKMPRFMGSPSPSMQRTQATPTMIREANATLKQWEETGRIARRDPQAESAAMLEDARAQIKESSVPQVVAVAEQIKDSLGSRFKRIVSAAGARSQLPYNQAEEDADRLNRMADAYATAIAETDTPDKLLPAWLRRGIRGVARTVPEMVAVGTVGGPYAAIASAMTQEMNQSVTEAKDAGLAGDDLETYVLTQGIIEGLPAALMQRVGLGGLEKIFDSGGRKVVITSIREGLKKAGINVSSELIEENITEIGHAIARDISGVDPDALDSDRLGQVVLDTTVQTLLTLGTVGAPSTVRDVQSIRNQRAFEQVEGLEEKVRSGGQVSRNDAKAWKRVTGETLSPKQSERTAYIRGLVEDADLPEMDYYDRGTLDEAPAMLPVEDEVATPQIGDLDARRDALEQRIGELDQLPPEDEVEWAFDQDEWADQPAPAMLPLEDEAGTNRGDILIGDDFAITTPPSKVEPSTPPVTSSEAKVAEESPKATDDAKQRVRAKIAELDSRPGGGTYIADLREAFPEMSHKELNEILLGMSRAGEAQVIRNDDGGLDERTKKNALVTGGGELRHIVKLAEAPSKAESSPVEAGDTEAKDWGVALPSRRGSTIPASTRAEAEAEVARLKEAGNTNAYVYEFKNLPEHTPLKPKRGTKAKPPTKSTPEKAPEAKVDRSKMTTKELVAEIRSRNIPGIGKATNKAKRIALLEEYDRIQEKRDEDMARASEESASEAEADIDDAGIGELAPEKREQYKQERSAWQEKHQAEIDGIKDRNAARAAVVKTTGLTLNETRLLQEGGYDHGVDPARYKAKWPNIAEKMRHFEAYAQEVASEFPGVFESDNVVAQADKAWALLVEGVQDVPSFRDYWDSNIGEAVEEELDDSWNVDELEGDEFPGGVQSAFEGLEEQAANAKRNEDAKASRGKIAGKKGKQGTFLDNEKARVRSDVTGKMGPKFDKDQGKLLETEGLPQADDAGIESARKDRKAELDDEFDDLLRDLSDPTKPKMGLDAALLGKLAKIASNRFERGMISLQEFLDSVKEGLGKKYSALESSLTQAWNDVIQKNLPTAVFRFMEQQENGPDGALIPIKDVRAAYPDMDVDSAIWDLVAQEKIAVNKFGWTGKGDKKPPNADTMIEEKGKYYNAVSIRQTQEPKAPPKPKPAPKVEKKKPEPPPVQEPPTEPPKAVEMEKGPIDSRIDDWLSDRQESEQEADSRAARHQDELKQIMGKRTVLQTLGEAFKGTSHYRLRGMDQAMHLYIDLKDAESQGFGTPAEQMAKYEGKLSSEQKAAFARSQSLPPAVQELADKIIEENKALGEEGLEAEVLKNVRDNYSARLWKQEPGEMPTDAVGKFTTTTSRARARTLESILHGWSLGKELQITGAIGAQQIASRQVSQAIHDRRMINAAVSEGLLSDTKQESDWQAVEHPNFKNWKWIGTAVEGEVYGRGTFITEDGSILQETPLYAPKYAAKALNNILGTSKLPGTGKITKWNAIFKQMMLSLSLFHHQAFLRSYMLGTHGKEGLRPLKAYKEGRQAILNYEGMTRELVRGGLTIGTVQDFDERLVKEKTKIGKVIDKVPVAAEVKNAMIALRDQQIDFLFRKMGARLKVMGALHEFQRLLKRNEKKLLSGEITREEIARIAAEQMNDDFGGLNLQKMRRNPTGQHIFRLLALAPDWTESNVRSMARTMASGETGAAYRRMWARVFLRAGGLTILSQLLMAGMDDEEDFWEMYQRQWKEGNLRWLDVDVTPLAKATGFKVGRGQRKYFSILGHFRDPVKFVTHPVRSAKHKGSILGSFVLEALTGTDWAGRKFTTFAELLGIDDKGTYKTSGKRSDGSTYKEGDPKGGQTAGQTVAWGKGRSLEYSQLPSFLISQSKGVLPIQVQNSIAWLAGEMDAFDAVTKSIGLMTSSTHPSQNKEGAYWDKTQYAAGNAEERQEQFEKDLENITWKGEPLAYSDLLTPAQMTKVEAKVTERKQKVLTDVTVVGEEDVKESTLKAREKAKERFEAMKQEVTHDQAQKLLYDYYRSQKKMSYGPKGWNGKSDRLAELYGYSEDDALKIRKRLRK